MGFIIITSKEFLAYEIITLCRLLLIKFNLPGTRIQMSLKNKLERIQEDSLNLWCYLILIQSNLAGPGPGFFHWEGISEVK